LAGKPGILAVAADPRGLLYAAGEIVRQSRHLPHAVGFTGIDIRSAPAFRFRGSSTNQGGTMRRITGARSWTPEEVREYMEDYALAGANCFYVEQNGGPFYDYVKSFGLMTDTGVRPNSPKLGKRAGAKPGKAAGGCVRPSRKRAKRCWTSGRRTSRIGPTTT
jgi:hypothetical protein